jgi:hypothetical protein
MPLVLLNFGALRASFEHDPYHSEEPGKISVSALSAMGAQAESQSRIFNTARRNCDCLPDHCDIASG